MQCLNKMKISYIILFTIVLLLTFCSSNESRWIDLGNGRFVNLARTSSISVRGVAILKDGSSYTDTRIDSQLYDGFIPTNFGLDFKCRDTTIHRRDSIIGKLIIYFDSIEYEYLHSRKKDSENSCRALEAELSGIFLRQELDRVLKPKSFLERCLSIFEDDYIRF